jgi:hypothetical protein
MRSALAFCRQRKLVCAVGGRSRFWFDSGVPFTSYLAWRRICVHLGSGFSYAPPASGFYIRSALASCRQRKLVCAVGGRSSFWFDSGCRASAFAPIICVNSCNLWLISLNSRGGRYFHTSMANRCLIVAPPCAAKPAAFPLPPSPLARSDPSLNGRHSAILLLTRTVR